jgi:hypothetical protein
MAGEGTDTAVGRYCRSGGFLFVFLLFLSCSAQTIPPVAADTDLRQVVDRLELEDLMHRYAYGVDLLDRELLARVFTPDAVLESVSGTEGDRRTVHLEGFDAIFTRVSGVLSERPDYGIPYHFVTNSIFEIDGENARIQAYMHDRNADATGVYYVDALRTPSGWRIVKLRVELFPEASP